MDNFHDRLNFDPGNTNRIKSFAMALFSSDLLPNCLVITLRLKCFFSQASSEHRNRSVQSDRSQASSSRHNYSKFKQAGDHVGHKTTSGGKRAGSQSSLLRIDSTESLDETDMRRPTYSPAVIRRTVSMDGLNRPWRHESEEDLRSKKSSVSIAVSRYSFKLYISGTWFPLV